MKPTLIVCAVEVSAEGRAVLAMALRLAHWYAAELHVGYLGSRMRSQNKSVHCPRGPDPGRHGFQVDRCADSEHVKNPVTADYFGSTPKVQLGGSLAGNDSYDASSTMSHASRVLTSSSVETIFCVEMTGRASPLRVSRRSGGRR